MEEHVCEICFFDFNDKENVPKVLECGHSFCFSCLSDLLQGLKRCPKCNYIMLKKRRELYPTNFSLLSIIESLSNLKLQQSHLKRLQILRRKLKEKMGALNEHIQEKKSQLDKINNDLLKVSEMMDSENYLLSFEQIDEVIAEVEEGIDTAEVTNDDITVTIRPTLLLNQFNHFDAFLNQVYDRVSKGEDVFATETINGRNRYGNISTWNKMLMVHSLTLTDIDDRASIISFRDLKTGITKQNFRTFLKLPLNERGATHTVVIKMMDSLLAPRFIKLCTGENGPTYKGSSFTKKSSRLKFESLIVVTNYSLASDEDDCPIDYDITSFEKRTYNENAILVERDNDGGFEIFKNGESECCFINVVGRVISNQHLICRLFYGGNKKILGSGIAFYV